MALVYSVPKDEAFGRYPVLQGTILMWRHSLSFELAIASMV